MVNSPVRKTRSGYRIRNARDIKELFYNYSWHYVCIVSGMMLQYLPWK